MTDPWTYAPGTVALGDWEKDNALFPAEDKWAAARAGQRAEAEAIVDLPVTAPADNNPKDWK